MSIQSEITRISGNVSDSLDAVSAKGVTVPSGSNSDDLAGLIAQIISSPTLQTKSVSYTPSETAQSDTVTADSGYDGLDEVDISVGAIASDYVGSGITRRSSSDLTASGATVTVPAGYYASDASKAVASGSRGTPVATKGTVSNHSISITPSNTSTAGYISGGTKTGTAVTVSASELVSGNKAITANGTGIDVTNYATASVNVPGLEYETGSFTPTSNITTKTVNFSKTHSKPPVIFLVFEATGTFQGNNYESKQLQFFEAIDIYSITKTLWALYQVSPDSKGIMGRASAYSSSSSHDYFRSLKYGASDTSQTNWYNATRYYLKESSASIYGDSGYESSSYYYTMKANKKYIWIAIWLPSTWTPPT